MGSDDSVGDGTTSSRRQTRRRFLEATGAASLTAVLAGCGGNSNGAGTANRERTTGDAESSTTGATSYGGSPTADAGTTSAPSNEEEGYPYGVGERRPDAAREVMEAAGYGPDERFTLTWFYRTQGDEVEATFETIRSWLEPAHVDLNAEYVSLEADVTRDTEVNAFLESTFPAYPAVEEAIRWVAPSNTHSDAGDEPLAPLFWTADSYHGPGRAAAMEAFDRVTASDRPTDGDATVRNEATRAFEEAVWTDVPAIPLSHGTSELLWHDGVDWSLHGALGQDRKRYDRVAVTGSKRLTVRGIGGNALDPIAWDSLAAVVTNVCETLTNAPDGTATVEPLLIDGYQADEEFTRYTFELKRGATFHDGSELTAADVVASLRRLAESAWSPRARRLTEHLGVEHDPRPDDDGEPRPGAAPGSTAIRATGEYEVEIELEEPTPAPLSVLASPACSVLPEDVVKRLEDGGRVAFGAEALVGTGPFEFGTREEATSITVERFDDYHGRSPTVESVRWLRPYSDLGSGPFQDGSADVVHVGGLSEDEFDPGKISIERTDGHGRRIGTYGPLTDGETVNYARIPLLTTLVVGFHCERTPVPVRRATAYALNVEALAGSFLAGRGIPAYHVTAPNLFPGGRSGYVDHYRG